jgi:hypothetical protein
MSVLQSTQTENPIVLWFTKRINVHVPKLLGFSVIFATMGIPYLQITLGRQSRFRAYLPLKRIIWKITILDTGKDSRSNETLAGP